MMKMVNSDNVNILTNWFSGIQIAHHSISAGAAPRTPPVEQIPYSAGGFPFPSPRGLRRRGSKAPRSVPLTFISRLRSC